MVHEGNTLGASTEVRARSRSGLIPMDVMLLQHRRPRTSYACMLRSEKLAREKLATGVLEAQNVSVSVLAAKPTCAGHLPGGEFGQPSVEQIRGCV